MRVLSPSAVSLVFLLDAVTGVAQQPPAQNSASARITLDTGTVDEGRQAGRDAANKRQVDRFGIAYGGGLSIGTLGPLVFQDDPLGPIGLATGIAMIGAVWKLGDNRPQAQFINERGETYRRAYADSYEKRLRQRRRNAAIVGGVAGIVGGLVTKLVVGRIIGTGY